MAPTTGTRADAVTFLQALAPDGALTFSTFTDGARKKPDPLARIMHGSYSRHRAKLAQLNAQGAGVCVLVNRGNCIGRTDPDIQAVRAVFLDLDGAPLEPVLAAPVAPAIVCESSPGKFHAYWPVAGMPLGDFRRAQQSLAAAYGGDPSICNLSRIMRLPGYAHAKREPFNSRLIHCDPTAPWDWPTLAEALGLPCSRTTSAVKSGWREGERNPALFRFACGLRAQGLGQADARERICVANANQCHPPLPDSELSAIIANAWKGETTGWAKLPHSILDDDRFRALPHPAKVALVALVRAHNGSNNGRLTLTRSVARCWGLKKRQRADALEACERAELIECTARGHSAAGGRRREPEYFRLLFPP